MKDMEAVAVLSDVNALDLITAFNKMEFGDAMLNTVQNFINTCLMNGEDSTVLSYQNELEKPLENYSYIFTNSQYLFLRIHNIQACEWLRILKIYLNWKSGNFTSNMG